LGTHGHHFLQCLIVVLCVRYNVLDGTARHLSMSSTPFRHSHYVSGNIPKFYSILILIRCAHQRFSLEPSYLPEFLSLDELLCQPHQHFGIIQSLVATALFYRVYFAGIVLRLQRRVWLTAVPACRSSVGCLVLFSLADQVPWMFIDPFFV
jgi:hypothetical protein